MFSNHMWLVATGLTAKIQSTPIIPEGSVGQHWSRLERIHQAWTC